MASFDPKKNEVGNVSTVNVQKAQHWIMEEVFLHNHDECIKAQAQFATMILDYFLETVGLKKDPSATQFPKVSVDPIHECATHHWFRTAFLLRLCAASELPYFLLKWCTNAAGFGHFSTPFRCCFTAEKCSKMLLNLWGELLRCCCLHVAVAYTLPCTS